MVKAIWTGNRSITTRKGMVMLLFITVVFWERLFFKPSIIWYILFDQNQISEILDRFCVFF